MLAACAQSVWLCVLMGLVGFVLELNKERFRRLEYGYSVALLTFPIVAIPGASPSALRQSKALSLHSHNMAMRASPIAPIDGCCTIEFCTPSGFVHYITAC